MKNLTGKLHHCVSFFFFFGHNYNDIDNYAVSLSASLCSGCLQILHVPSDEKVYCRYFLSLQS